MAGRSQFAHPFVARVCSRSRGIGSGILVGERRVLTCWHVANGSGEFEEEGLNAQQAAGKLTVEVGGRTIGARVLRWGVDGHPGLGYEVDVALLALDEPAAGVELAPLGGPFGAEEFAALVRSVSFLKVHGFAHGSRLPHVEGCRPPEESVTEVEPGLVTELGLALRAHEGMSGGPVLVYCGGRALCVGMASLGGSRSTAMVAVASGLLLRFLGDEAPAARELKEWLPSEGAAETRGRYLGDLRQRMEGLHDLLRRVRADDLSRGFFERVFVRLDVRMVRDDAGLGTEGLTLRRLLALQPEAFGRAGHRWVLRGEPGSGKTTVLRQLAHELACEGRGEWTPVYVRLPRLAKWLAAPREGDVWAKLRAFLGEREHLGEDRLDLLDEERDRGRLLLLLDALDEVRGDEREDLLSWLVSLSERLDRSAAVVATRGIPYTRPGGGYLEADLLRMSEEQQVRFLAAWIGDGEAGTEGARRWVQSLQGSRLRELVGNPLWLTFVGLILRQGGVPDESRLGLYQQVFELLLAGGHHDPATPIPHAAAVRVALRRLAVHMSEEGRESLAAEEVQDFFFGLEEGERFRAALRSGWGDDVGSFLADIAECTGILGPYDDPGEWKFWHAALRELLVEGWLADQERGPLLELAGGLDEERLGFYAEPFALLAGDGKKTRDADELIHALVESNRALGLRALAGAPRVRPETVAEVLGTAAEEDAGARGAALARIPEPVSYTHLTLPTIYSV